MRLAIVGPRDLMLPISELEEALRKFHRHKQLNLNDVTEIVSGDARGVDATAINFAKKHGYPWAEFGAGWGKLKKGAGPERNGRLIGYLDPAEDIVVALMDSGPVKGTMNTVQQAIGQQIAHITYKNAEWTKYREKCIST